MSAVRQCEICQASVPSGPHDDDFEEDGYPPSLIEHRWTAHAIASLTLCEHCGEPMMVSSLADHLSLEHNLPPPSVEQRRLYDAERRIRREIGDLGERIAAKLHMADAKLPTTVAKLSGANERTQGVWLFWIVVWAIVVAKLP